MATDWDALLLTFLRDQPGKAAGLRGHERRAGPLASVALGRVVSPEQLHSYPEQLAAFTEGFPFPGPELAPPGDGEPLRIHHPLSGDSRPLDLEPLTSQLDPVDEAVTLTELLRDLDSPRSRFLAVWRLWQERLAARQSAWALIPSDRRLPDRTLWNQLDTASGVTAALEAGRLAPAVGPGVALLSFSLGPVQPFLAAARTVRDLWTGSYLLSWLTFAAMRPILDELGPSAIVSPALRGNPLLDRYLRNLDDPALASLIPEPSAERLLTPCLPNRFLAFVPWGEGGVRGRASGLACELACRTAWREIAEGARAALTELFQRQQIPHSGDWDRLWKEQIESVFELRSSVLPLEQCDEATLSRLLYSEGDEEKLTSGTKAVRSLVLALSRGAPESGSGVGNLGLWGPRLELLGRLAEAARAARHLPDYFPPADVFGRWPAKCSLLGTYEQMGPAGLAPAAEFWNSVANLSLGGTRVRPGERLCAVSLVKRFAWPAYFAPLFKLAPGELRYPDTATVAARSWLAEGEILDPETVREEAGDWSGQWLHWTTPDQGKDEGEGPVPEWVWRRIREKLRVQGRPPTYYAILLLDGDSLGKWLRGTNGPAFEAVLAPSLAEAARQLPGGPEGLAAPRPTGPALQGALSEALSNFALHFAPAVIEKHQGTLVYAGGDDVLCLLPTSKALACASELEMTFRQDWVQDAGERERLLPGNRATLSAGLAVVHYKEDLSFGLRAAREAEQAAKKAGRSALCVRVCRRSGEDSSAWVGWEQTETLGELIEAFGAGATDRWAYRLRALLGGLASPELPLSAFELELGRQLSRLGSEGAPRADFAYLVEGFFGEYRREWESGRRQGGISADQKLAFLEGFLTLCQAASFLARGEDLR